MCVQKTSTPKRYRPWNKIYSKVFIIIYSLNKSTSDGYFWHSSFPSLLFGVVHLPFLNLITRGPQRGPGSLIMSLWSSTPDRPRMMKHGCKCSKNNAITQPWTTSDLRSWQVKVNTGKHMSPYCTLHAHLQLLNVSTLLFNVLPQGTCLDLFRTG